MNQGIKAKLLNSKWRSRLSRFKSPHRSRSPKPQQPERAGTVDENTPSKVAHQSSTTGRSQSTAPQKSDLAEDADQAPSTAVAQHVAHEDNRELIVAEMGSDEVIPGPVIAPRSTINLQSNADILTSNADIWTRAYQEAVFNLQDDVKTKIPTAKTIEDLLAVLEKTNTELAGNSLFRKGLARLRGPLRGLKLALDVTKPLSNAAPAAAIAVGVISGVTGIAIAICGADENFSGRMVKMLEQVPIIDECDILGQKLGTDSGVYKALVPVYQDLLHFYVTASQILSSKVFLLAILCDQLNNSIPSIVDNFLSHTNNLRRRIENATLDLLGEVKEEVLDRKSMTPWNKDCNREFADFSPVQMILGVEKDRQWSEFYLHVLDTQVKQACNWLDTDARFVQWYNATSFDRVILFGNMGSGKTYATAHVVDELTTRSAHQLPQPLVCHHYCNDRETANATCVYSNLVLQLLNQRRGYKAKFDKWYETTKSQKPYDPARSTADLGDFLISCLDGLDRQIFVIIDGLDECDKVSQRKIVALFDSLIRTQKLKVFISSRPTEAIKELLPGWHRIDLRPSRDRDSLIAQHSIEEHLPTLETEARSIFLDTISRLANGNAQWIRTIVELAAAMDIATTSGMRAFLEDLPYPTELSKVYAKAFSQATGNHSVRKKRLTSALEILAVAQRPLSILELIAAVTLADPGVDLRRVDEIPKIQDLINAGGVLTHLQPFIAPIDLNNLKKRQISIGHHSLRELICREVPSGWEQMDELVRLSNDRVKHRRVILEAALFRICIKYLLLEEIDHYDLFPGEFKTALELQDMPGEDIFGDPGNSPAQEGFSQIREADTAATDSELLFYDPAESGLGHFFVYASCFWRDHLRATSEEPISDIPDIADVANIVRLCRPGSKRLQNWTQQQLYPECTLQPNFRPHHNDLDPLIILSLVGSPMAIKLLLQNYDVNGHDFLKDSFKRAFDALRREGDPSMLHLILQYRDPASDFPKWDFLYALMYLWQRLNNDSKRDHKWFDAVYDMLGTAVDEKWGTTLLCIAVECDCLPMIKILLDEAKHNDGLRREMLEHGEALSNTPNYKSFMMEAVRYGSYETLEYLLSQEGVQGDLQRVDDKRKNVFHYAALRGEAGRIGLLIRHWKEGVDQISTTGDTPLKLAVFGNHIETARELLMTGDVDVRGGHNGEWSKYDEPLRTAVRARNVAMCRLLVEVGGANARDALQTEKDGQLCLMDPGTATSPVLDLLCSLATER